MSLEVYYFFFFNDAATTEIYTLSLHDALPIYVDVLREGEDRQHGQRCQHPGPGQRWERSEEHTSELQSRLHLVCRLLLEKKKQSGESRGPAGRTAGAERGAFARAGPHRPVESA